MGKAINTMPKIKLDDLEYNTEDLTEESQAQLRSLTFVEAELNKLKNEIAIYETAKVSYANALKIEIERAGIEPVSEAEAEGD